MISYTIIVVIGGSPIRKAIAGKSPEDAIKRYVRHSWGSGYKAHTADGQSWSIFRKWSEVAGHVSIVGAEVQA